MYDSRVVKSHLQGVTMGVVWMNICDYVNACISKWHCKCMSIQINSNQLNIFGNISEVDSEHSLLEIRY